MTETKPSALYKTLSEHITLWTRELGFQQVGITDIDLSGYKERLDEWLEQGYHGEMQWIERHQAQREDPQLLVADAMRVISVRMDYLPENTEQIKTLKQANKAYISRYALGRDYHKLIRKRLAKLAKKIEAFCEQHAEIAQSLSQRPFVDSAPVLEKAFGEKSGLGWIGKHTVLLNEKAGSWFFLGELITNLALPLSLPEDTAKDAPQTNDDKNKCGDCTACLKVCPTDAFVAPYQLDARRCISYLTIELKGTIPIEFREPIGNRVFGCDDCQLICPWNKWASPTQEQDFSPRHQLDDTELTRLFLWSEEEYLQYTEGSAIRRLGFERWLRNLAIGLGNAEPTPENIAALDAKKDYPSSMVQEHINWALQRLRNPKKRVRKIKNTNK